MFTTTSCTPTIITRLCSQAELLRASLRDKMDGGDLPSAVEIAERCVGNDCIVALLAMVQCVERDVDNDFRPVSVASVDDGDDDVDKTSAHQQHQLMTLNKMADIALLTLSDLYDVGESHLKSRGWIPIYDQSPTVSGGIVYEHDETGEVSEEPDYEVLNWRMRLMLSIPILIQPGCDADGRVVWAASVVYYRHGYGEEEQFGLETPCSEQTALGSASSYCVSVIDVLKSDEDGQSARLRGTYRGCWRGLYAEAVGGEMDMTNTSSSIGQVLESWTETTLAGLSVTNNKRSASSSSENEKDSAARILVIGLGCGQLVSFLRNHVDNAELRVIESSRSMVDIATEYFHFPPSLLCCVSVVDPSEFVKSQCPGDQDVGDLFDTVIVNVCSIDDTFPHLLLNDDFFSGLISILSNHPAATLLVNPGKDVEAVSLLVDRACKSIKGKKYSGQMLVLREHLLRDHTASDDEGVIVAARRREWSLTVDDWQREHMGEDAQSSGAMDVAAAQRTQVVRLEKFLSSEDIAMVRAVAEAELASMGKEEASADGGSALEAHTESWKVLYLQSKNVFRRKLPALRQRILDTVRRVDESHWNLFDKVDHVNIRVVEYHQMDEFGELADPRHYDLNSLLTMDIMLSEDDAFEGGDLQTLEEADGTLRKHEFKRGDALIFVSHKYHCVGRVRSGRRNVMVLEFWYGPERQCSHRCERFGGEICNRDPGQSSYTRQYQNSYVLKEHVTSSTPLPFRLGSVARHKGESRESLELLWEPCGSADEDVAKDKPASVSEGQSTDKPSDAFACFGSDSDSDGDEVVTDIASSINKKQVKDKALGDAFACFGSDSESDDDR